VSGADTKTLIETGRFLDEVPALQNLKLVAALELRGRGDVQLYRIEMPGAKVTKDIASDARLRIVVPRANFNDLATEGNIRQWHAAYDHGDVKFEATPDILKLLANVVGRQEERSRTRKARH
jgi:hypothetical protein